jgi:hypothetical protein
MDVLLCSLSAKRVAMLEEDPEMLAELISARHEVEIPGLFDLGKTWHALDLLLAEAGDAVLTDAVMARSGAKLRVVGKMQARLLPPARVTLIAKALGALTPALIKERYPSLYGKEVHGNYGQEICGPGEVAYIRESVKKIHTNEIRELEMALAGITALYASAVGTKASMMSVIV